VTQIMEEQLAAGAVSLFGVLDVDQRAAGVSRRRSPGWTRPQLPRAMDAVVRMPSIVRLAFATDSSSIRLERGTPDTPILLTSPIFCPSAEHSPGPTFPEATGSFVTLAGHGAVQSDCLNLERIRGHRTLDRRLGCAAPREGAHSLMENRPPDFCHAA